jgi:hypothetical protein
VKKFKIQDMSSFNNNSSINVTFTKTDKEKKTRHDMNGTIIARGSKKHKVTFRDEVSKAKANCQ